MPLATYAGRFRVFPSINSLFSVVCLSPSRSCGVCGHSIHCLDLYFQHAREVADPGSQTRHNDSQSGLALASDSIDAGFSLPYARRFPSSFACSHLSSASRAKGWKESVKNETRTSILSCTRHQLLILFIKPPDNGVRYPLL